MDQILRVNGGLASTVPRHIFTGDKIEYNVELRGDIIDTFGGEYKERVVDNHIFLKWLWLALKSKGGTPLLPVNTFV